MDNLLDGLVAIVRYRRKDDAYWSTMAAFDSMLIAEKYAKECSGEKRPWVYEAVELESKTD